MAKTILVTGAAGFIGAAISHRLILRGENVIGIDNLNDYYDVNLKKQLRIKIINETASKINSKWHFFNSPIEDKSKLNDIADILPPTLLSI